MKNCVLKIWIGKKPVDQGKFYYLNKKPIFLVNIDENKLWTKFNGYSIANQILETFKTAKIRPLILYKHIKMNLIYQTVPSTFYKKAIQVNYGSHRQLILPVKEWKFFKDDPQEPFNLPALTVQDLLKKQDNDVHVKIAEDVRIRLKEEWNTKYA